MSSDQIAEALLLLGQRMTIKEVTAWVGCSEWQIVDLIPRGRSVSAPL